MNRYEVFRLVQELGQLIEGAYGKTTEEVAHELVACGQRRLAEAAAVSSLNHPTNGTTIPLPSTEATVASEPEDVAHSVTAPVSAGAARA